eukprot:Skav226139  [mRNA]  locus=scaffold1047:564514:565992:- [translate_table: standard]
MNKSNCTVLCINQLRANIGSYGLAEDTVGGKGIKYAATMRLEVRSPKSGMLGTAEAPTGIRSKVKVVKNKLAAPYRLAEPCLLVVLLEFWAERQELEDAIRSLVNPEVEVDVAESISATAADATSDAAGKTKASKTKGRPKKVTKEVPEDAEDEDGQGLKDL